jgi:hypothetical protein
MPLSMACKCSALPSWWNIACKRASDAPLGVIFAAFR